MPDTSPTLIPALQVNQWLSHWNDITWNPQEHRSEPPRSFYQFSISAQVLRQLSGVYRRTTDRRRGTSDLGIQRRHEPKRSEEIARFVKYGYPWSVLSATRRQQPDFADLRQPGWLPTAILVNILTPADVRRGKHVAEGDLVTVQNAQDVHHIVLPSGFSSEAWEYETIPPVEVIDGQHRLWAFDQSVLDGDFDLPVVAFHGLDRSWQAYLFYTINIKPKKINPSLAFDLYPLLRTETWLERLEGPKVYRESRAQEIVDILWSHAESPWYRRINMLGEPGHRGLMVTQAGWVRSLMASFVKRWEGRGAPGGLFGGSAGSDLPVLSWSLEQQAAFLIFFGRQFRLAIREAAHGWMSDLRERSDDWDEETDPAFIGRHNLLNQDQGVRAFLLAVNDICRVAASAWFSEASVSDGAAADESSDVSSAIWDLESNQVLSTHINALSQALAEFDWRSSDAPGLGYEERLRRGAFRGSGGYRVLREELLRHLSDDANVGSKARAVLQALDVGE